MKISCYLFLVFACANFLVTVVLAALGRFASDATRSDGMSFYVPIGVINLLLDVAIIVLPMPALYKLQIDLGKRISLIAIFALGFWYVNSPSSIPYLQPLIS